jgi:hypothetical protein
MTFLVVVPLISVLPAMAGRARMRDAGVDHEGEAQGRRPKRPPAAAKPRVDYSRFSHQTHVTAQKLACDACHKFPTANWKEFRGDAAFQDVADFPDHGTCLSCHRPQFFARERPAPAICSNCHVNVSPRNNQRYLFPSLGDMKDPGKPRRDVSSDFLISFPHDKHADVVSLNIRSAQPPPRFGFLTVSSVSSGSPQQKPAAKESAEPKNCPVCHQIYQPQGKSDDEYVTKPPKDLGDNFWLKKGSFMTIPNSHTTCFSCHNADLGIAPAPSDCNGCHKLAAPQAGPKTDFDAKVAEKMGVSDRVILGVWSRRISSGTYRHEGGDHPNLGCPTCHNVMTMNTAERKTLAVPVKSCGGAEGCHVTATADEGGILNYEIDQRKTNAAFACSKWHLSLGTAAIPASHVSAIPKSAK